MDSALDLTVREFLDRLGSQAPTPGGGAAAALSGALAAGLGRMVCGLTIGKPKFAAVEPQLQTLAARLATAEQLLAGLIDEDMTAYGGLHDAFKLDKTDPGRPRQIQDAALLAAGVPLETAAIATRVLADARALLAIGNPNLRSDSTAAMALAQAAARAALANVEANLSLLAPADAERVRHEMEGLSACLERG